MDKWWTGIIVIVLSLAFIPDVWCLGVQQQESQSSYRQGHPEMLFSTEVHTLWELKPGFHVSHYTTEIEKMGFTVQDIDYINGQTRYRLQKGVQQYEVILREDSTRHTDKVEAIEVKPL